MRRAAVIAFAVATFAAAPPAFADAIDGQWCAADGRNLTIDGPKIRTPGGQSITGQYSRHEFAYRAPAGDADSGQIVYMRIFDEEDMGLVHFKGGSEAGPVEQWRRCAPTS